MLRAVGSVFATSAPAVTVLIRVAVGCVFLSEGIQKFLFSAQLGAGRFSKIGIPAPEVMAAVVGCLEIVCGALVIAGLLTRLAAVPLIAIMVVAISTTKVPMLSRSGFWTMAHESRTDFSMLLGAAFLLVAGAGRWSLDARLAGRRQDSRAVR